jgi:2-dehydro-3-deoxyphosphogluconate aldolase/(4S)-4-hydroxy-2-oxoglutarate aldolase
MTAREPSAGRVPVPAEIRESGIIAILRSGHAIDVIEQIGVALSDGGVRAVEVTTNSSDAHAAIERLRQRLPDVLVGVGTVTTLAQLQTFAGAGAQFVVMPNTDPPVIEDAVRRGLANFPGALTPTEVLNAWRAGASAVKVFPAGTVGPDYFRALAGPYPEVELVATGGFRIAEATDYLAAGARAVAMGTELVPSTETELDLEAVQARARELVIAVRSTRAMSGARA